MNIIVCFGKPNDVNTIRNLLGHYGYKVAFSCMSGVRALEACEKLGSGLLICGYRLSDMVCTELFDSMPRGFTMITMCSPQSWETAPPKEMEVLDMPVRASNVISRVEETVMRAEQARRMRRQQARRGMAGRSDRELALISEAKQMLIDRRGYDEPRAHRYLQEMAMRSGDSLADTAAKLMELAAEGGNGF